MKCPNCKQEMKSREGFNKFRCVNCEINYIDKHWDVPLQYQPTDKQKRTIGFINGKLNTSFESITKHQSWEIIRDNFEDAKNVGKYNYCLTDEDCDMWGMDPGMFC